MKPKTKSIERYKKIYCVDKRVRDRRVLYVSEKVHSTFSELALKLRDTHITMASLVDTILQHHIDTNRGVIDEILNDTIEENTSESRAEFDLFDYSDSMYQ